MWFCCYPIVCHQCRRSCFILILAFLLLLRSCCCWYSFITGVPTIVGLSASLLWLASLLCFSIHAVVWRSAATCCCCLPFSSCCWPPWYGWRPFSFSTHAIVADVMLLVTSVFKSWCFHIVVVSSVVASQLLCCHWLFCCCWGPAVGTIPSAPGVATVFGVPAVASDSSCCCVALCCWQRWQICRHLRWYRWQIFHRYRTTSQVANLPPSSLIPVTNFPPVSNNVTGGKFATCVPAVHLDFRKSLRILEKI